MKIQNRFALVTILGLLVSLFILLPVSPVRAENKRISTVMTQNLYFGADLTPVISAPDLPTFITEATIAWINARNTNIPARMDAVAAQIQAKRPHIVGLQEVAMWRTGPLFDPAPATAIESDFLNLLLDSLENRGLAYQVVAYASGFDTEVPLPALGFDGRLSIADVILARTDLPASELFLSNPQTGRYQTILTLPSPAGPISLSRQWASVDVKIRGKSFRFVSTHLEPYHPLVRSAQAQELLGIHSSSGLPVVYVGDFNSVPGVAGDAAQILIDSDLQDAWMAQYPALPGPTCCQDAHLLNQFSQLSRRIDLVLVTPDFDVLAADIVGDEENDKTPSGHWPSDHAGLVTTIILEAD